MFTNLRKFHALKMKYAPNAEWSTVFNKDIKVLTDEKGNGIIYLVHENQKGEVHEQARIGYFERIIYKGIY